MPVTRTQPLARVSPSEDNIAMTDDGLGPPDCIDAAEVDDVSLVAFRLADRREGYVSVNAEVTCSATASQGRRETGYPVRPGRAATDER